MNPDVRDRKGDGGNIVYSLRPLFSDILTIGLEREPHLVQQARHRVGTDFDTEAN